MISRSLTCCLIALLGLTLTAAAQGPTAAFTADQTTGKGALTVWFTDASTPGASEITEWAWDFGDGSTGILGSPTNPVHIFEYPGVYTVSLTVSDANGADTCTQTDLITITEASIFRVDIDNTSGTEDGLTWATAYNTIQEGVDAAHAAGGGEVWVAGGRYRSLSNPVVLMNVGVHIFAGFGSYEIVRSQRNWEVNETIIDGENVRRGVQGANNATLDGFTITRGYNNLNGGGIRTNAPTTISNCSFKYNQVSGTGTCDGGAGFYNYMSRPTLTNCIFHSNTSSRLGGAVYNYGGSACYTNCLFTDNTVETYNHTACGGGIYNYNFSGFLSNCVFYNNTLFSSNGGTSGGAIHSEHKDPNISNCILWNNSANQMGGIGKITYSNIQGGFLGEGNIDAPPFFVNAAGYDYRLSGGSPCIDRGTMIAVHGLDITGSVRPRGFGVDMGIYEMIDQCDTDHDGLSDLLEEEHGCNSGIQDAALYSSIYKPSNGASFQAPPIIILGILSGGSINNVAVSTDGGRLFDKEVVFDDGTWMCEWTPPTQGSYQIAARAGNQFLGYTDSLSTTIHYQPDAPEAYIISPIHRSHINGQLTVTGKAAQGTAGFGSYTLEFTAGEDPDAVGPWTTIQSSPTEVIDGTLGTWNVLALPEGPHTLRLRADDGAGTESKTWVVVYVDHDTTAPAAPGSIQVEGLVNPALVANNDTIATTGQGDGDCYLALAELIDENGDLVKDVTTELTLHFSGALRGECTMPSSVDAAQVALRVLYKDAVGNVGPATTSNYLTVENGPPTIAIDYLQDNAICCLNSASPETYTLHGVSADTGDAGVREVEVRINSGDWSMATGTTEWTYDWTPESTGSYTITARATDALDNSTTTSITVTVTETSPAAYITAPAAGDSIFSGETVAITGTAIDATDFQDYQVQYRDTGAPDWTLITPTPITTQVHEGLLAQWDTTGLDSPAYELQLIVRDTSANVSTHTISIGILADLSMSGLEDVSFYEGGQRYHYAYLPDFVSPSEGAAGYTYTLVTPLPPEGMGVEINGEKYLNIIPEENWFGWQDVTIQVEDGLGHVASDTLRIEITNLNDAPSPPTLVLDPARPGDSDELICSIDAHGADVDGDAFLYVFEWYRSTNGVQFGEVVRSVSVLADEVNGSSDSLSSLETAPGDWWRCVVRGYDGEAYGNPAIAMARIYQNSSLSLAVDPAYLTLGESVTLSGAVSGIAGVAPVAFRSTSPAGLLDELYPEGAVTGSTGEFTKTFYPKEATTGRGPWMFQAYWDGDDAFGGSESAWKSIIVEKADPSLTLEPSHNSALLQLENVPDFSVTASLRASRFPAELSTLFASQSIRLSVQDPDGETPYAPLVKQTDGWGAAVFEKADFDAAAVAAGHDAAFDEAGAWKFKAEFDETENFLTAVSADFDVTEARVTIKEGAGYAILVLGQLDEYGEGRPEHGQSLDYVEQVLLARNFAPEDIRYLRHQDDPDETLRPTKENLQYAVETWARNKMLASPAPLYLILADHGSPGVFHLDVDGTAAHESVTDTELGTWLNVLQSALYGNAADQDIFLIYGACYSGSFIELLAAPNRVLITSTGADEISYRGELDPVTGLRDGEFFLMEFFRNAGMGRSIRDCFEQACALTSEYTATSSNGLTASVPQHPQLDDNNDGISTTGELCGLSGDGFRVAGMDLGLGSNAATGLTWFAATPTVTIDPNEKADLVLQGETTGRDPEAEDVAWLQIKTPAYAGGAVPEGADPAFQREADMVGPIYAAAPVDGVYTWTQADIEAFPGFDGFTTPGTYKVYYFLRDADADRTGAYVVTHINVRRDGNTPPTTPTLLYPADGATVNANAWFAWGESNDIDGDTVLYTVDFASDVAFTELIATQPYLHATYLNITPLTLPTGDCYWRVTADDGYGGVATSAAHLVTIDGNPGFEGALAGILRDGEDNTPISGATVCVVEKGLTSTTDSYGRYFFGALTPGSYSLEITCAGYVAQTNYGVMVLSGNIMNADYRLTPEGGAFLWGELTGDALLGIMDGVAILQWQRDGLRGLAPAFAVAPELAYPAFPEAADVNADSVVGLLDASDILRVKVGLDAAFLADTDGNGYGPEGKGAALLKARSSVNNLPALADLQAAGFLPKDTAYTTISIATDLAADPGQEVLVPVVIDGESGTLGYFIRLTYDAAVLEFVDAANGALTAAWSAPMVNAGEAGLVQAAGIDADALPGSGELLLLRFRVHSTASGRSSVLHFDAAQLNDGQIPVSPQDGRISISGVALEGEAPAEGESGEGNEGSAEGAEEGVREGEAEGVITAEGEGESKDDDALNGGCSCVKGKGSFKDLGDRLGDLLLFGLALINLALWRRR